MNELNKNCPNCEREFVAARLNQRYCSRFCQIQKNNKDAKEKRSMRRLTKGINNVLWENRECLHDLWEQMDEPEEAFGVDLEIDEYFDTDYFTGYKTNEDGVRWYFCYDFTYTMDSGSVSEVRKIQ